MEAVHSWWSLDLEGCCSFLEVSRWLLSILGDNGGEGEGLAFLLAK